MLFIVIGMFQAHQTTANPIIQQHVLEVSRDLKSLDDTVTKLLKEMLKNGGDYLLEVMRGYNSKLSKLEELLMNHRNETLSCSEASQLIQEGAPDYFHVKIDRDLGIAQFGWQDRGFDEVFKQRAGSIEIWTRINRRSRLIPLEFYTYPENSTYEGYECTLFPPLKEN